MKEAFAPRSNRQVMADGDLQRNINKQLRLKTVKDGKPVDTGKFNTVLPTSSSSVFGTFNDNKGGNDKLVDPFSGVYLKEIKKVKTEQNQDIQKQLGQRGDVLVDISFLKFRNMNAMMGGLENIGSKQQKKLVEFQSDISKYLVNIRSKFRLNRMPNENEELFTTMHKALDSVCRNFRLRQETRMLASFLWHMVSTKVVKEEMLNYFIPCIMAATKTEEYYPPTIKELLSQVRCQANMLSLKNQHFRDVNQDLCVLYEGKLLGLVGFYIMNPPLFDLGNIVLNELNLEYHTSQALLKSTLIKMLSLPQLFSYSLPVIISVAIETANPFDKENRIFAPVLERSASGQVTGVDIFSRKANFSSQSGHEDSKPTTSSTRLATETIPVPKGNLETILSMFRTSCGYEMGRDDVESLKEELKTLSDNHSGWNMF